MLKILTQAFSASYSIQDHGWTSLALRQARGETRAPATQNPRCAITGTSNTYNQRATHTFTHKISIELAMPRDVAWPFGGLFDGICFWHRFIEKGFGYQS